MILMNCALCVKIGETFTNTLIYDLKKLSIALHYDRALYDCIEFWKEWTFHMVFYNMFFSPSFTCREQLCIAAQRDSSVCQHFITLWQHRLRWQMAWIFSGDAVFYAARWRCTTCALEIKPSGERLHFWVKLWVNISCPQALLEPVSNGLVVLLSSGGLYWLRTRLLIKHWVSECGWGHHS